MSSTTATGRTKQPHILCIDDNVPGLETRTLLLQAWGYSVTTALSGKEGISVLERSAVDAVVVDYIMPEMNGGEVARLIKSRWPDLPIIMVSGWPRIPLAAKASVDSVIMKGSRCERLRSALDALLRAEPSTGRTEVRRKNTRRRVVSRSARIMIRRRRNAQNN